MIDDVSNEVARHCLVTRTRKISRVLTGLYDQALRPFGINSPQFTLLVMISRLAPASRAEIGRQNHQDRSTLTRNLQLMLSEGWVKEIPHPEGGRGRPIVLTAAGKALLSHAVPAWRTAQSHAKQILGRAGVNAIMEIAKQIPTQSV